MGWACVHWSRRGWEYARALWESGRRWRSSVRLGIEVGWWGGRATQGAERLGTDGRIGLRDCHSHRVEIAAEVQGEAQSGVRGSDTGVDGERRAIPASRALKLSLLSVGVAQVEDGWLAHRLIILLAVFGDLKRAKGHAVLEQDARTPGRRWGAGAMRRQRWRCRDPNVRGALQRGRRGRRGRRTRGASAGPTPASLPQAGGDCWRRRRACKKKLTASS